MNSNNTNMFKQEVWGVDFEYVNGLISQVGFRRFGEACI